MQCVETTSNGISSSVKIGTLMPEGSQMSDLKNVGNKVFSRIASGPMRIRVIVIASVFLSTAAVGDEMFYVTPSGASETMFGIPAKEAISSITNQCMEMGWRIESVSDNQAVCRIEIERGRSGRLASIVGAVPFVSGKRDVQAQYVRFSASTIAPSVSRAQAVGWTMEDKTFGKAEENEIKSPRFHDSMIVLMLDAGGQLPKGTSFPNHALLDLSGESREVNGEVGYYVLAVGGNGPAAEAGILAEDLIVRVAGRRVRDFDSLQIGLEKAAQRSEFEIELFRRGKIEVSRVQTRFRPTVVEDIAPKALSSVSANTTQAPTASIADELSKLAKLKEQGLLTQKEFDDEKRKLLAK